MPRTEPGPVAIAIREKLTAALAPTRLEIVDQSHLHADHFQPSRVDNQPHEGHAGGRRGGETHFKVTIVSPAFAGLSRPDRQRRVYATLAEELAGPVHALSLKTLTTEEAAAH